MSPTNRRRLQILAPATVTLLVLLGVILAAPLLVAQSWLVKPCGFREISGLPCLACGGTRSVLALAEGDWLSALRFNPLIVLAIAAVGLWFLNSLFRAWLAPPRPPVDAQRQVKRAVPWLIALGVAAIGNWIYLVYWLPE